MATREHDPRKHSARLALGTSILLCLLCLLPAASGQAQQAASAKVHDPERAAELAAEALAYLERGEAAEDDEARLSAYREGERLAQQALDLDDSSADAHFALFANSGRRMLLEGAATNAFNLLEVNRRLDRCLELDPNHSDALAARGGMYRQLPFVLGGSLRKAEKDLQRSIELDPKATGARIELARTYLDMGDAEKARPLLQEALYWAEQLNKPRRVREARAVLADLPGK